MSVQRKFVVEIMYEKCVGCRACETACSLKHEKKIWPAASRIRVRQFKPGPLDMPILCLQCTDYPCVDACPKKIKAISVNEENAAVIVDSEKCLGQKCGMCSKACRLQSAITFHPVTKKALVCDLCDGEPSCAKACPKEALQVVPASLFATEHQGYGSIEEQAEDFAIRMFGECSK